MSWTPQRALFLFATLSSSALAATVKTSGVNTSSYLVSDQGEIYESKYLTDGKQETAWIEGEEGSGLGSWVEIDLGGTRSVTGLKVWNGYWITHDFWQRHNRAKEIEVEFSDGTKSSYTLKDEMVAETVKFTTKTDTDKLKIRIKSVYRGNTFNDSGFSEIQVTDASPNTHYEPAAYGTSSTLAADGDGNYNPSNLTDGISDSMWCEGNAEGDGVAEWIEMDFGRSNKISKLRLKNGSAGSFSSFMATNRAKAATLSFSDGSTERIAIKASMMEQTIMFAPRNASKVKITFDEVVKGAKYNDLRISEAAFLP